jgi:hypothetical protein
MFELVEFIFAELSVVLLLVKGDVVCGDTVVEFVLLLFVLSTWANSERQVKVQIKDMISVFIK